MTQPANGTGRLHALDNLRAVMMWLGIVLHVAVIYMVGPSPLPWRDLHTTPWADLLMVLIHSFRMPVFFILAGFFVALLVQGRGLRGMLKNRLLRLGLPFAILWPVIFVACVLLALLFVHRMVRGTWGLDASLIPPKEGSSKWNNTMHLWFLWMLMWFSVFTALLAPLVKAIPDAAQGVVSRAFERLASSAGGFAVLALPLAALGAVYDNGVVVASGAFLPPLTEWLHNGLFFVFGLGLFVHRSQLLALYQQRWSAYAGAGLVFFAVAVTLSIGQREHLMVVPHFAFWFALAYNCCTWLWSFALIGLFLRYFGRRSTPMDYLAQGSYWVYVIHMPLTMGFGALLFGTDLPALVKMAINIGATTTASLVSYHLMVRSTPLGDLLNGRRYPFTGFGIRPPVAQPLG